MGLFNFLKKNRQSPDAVENENLEQQATESYLGDLNKTAILYQLIETTPDKRDEQWQATFLANIGQASFRSGSPQVIIGPDGFPYFQLFLPEPNQRFQCYVIERMKDDFLLASGLGIAINPTANGADWVLSHGDILNMHLNKTFYTTTETPFSREKRTETIDEEEQVLIGQPSEEILPQQTRQLIAAALLKNGVKAPKVLLMARQREHSVTQDLVFNLTPNIFENESAYSAAMQMIGWHLPRHYSFVGMDESIFGDGFMPL